MKRRQPIDWNATVSLDKDLAQELGVVAYYPGWPSGGNTLFDATRRYDGTLAGGATWEPGRDGRSQAMRFDGVDDYADLGTPLIPATNGFSFFGHIYFVAGTGGNGGSPVSQYPGTGRFVMLTTGTNYRVNLNGGDVFNVASVFSVGKWYSFALTRSGSSFIGYVDGAQIGSGTKASSIIQVNTRLGIDSASAFKSNCRMEGFGVTNTTLTANQVWNLHEQPHALAWQPARRRTFFVEAGGGGGAASRLTRSKLLRPVALAG